MIKLRDLNRAYGNVVFSVFGFFRKAIRMDIDYEYSKFKSRVLSTVKESEVLSIAKDSIDTEIFYVTFERDCDRDGFILGLWHKEHETVLELFIPDIAFYGVRNRSQLTNFIKSNLQTIKSLLLKYTDDWRRENEKGDA